MSVIQLFDAEQPTPALVASVVHPKPHARVIDQADTLVDEIIACVGNKIVLGIPLAVGKPVAFVNALYQRAKHDPSLSLRIETGISLEKPVGKSALEKHFLEPFVEREFANVPDLDYMLDLRRGCVPDNIVISEFFFKAGSFLNSPQQRNYTSTNYTHAVRDLLDKGVNVIAQIVGKRTCGQDHEQVTTYSLGSNSDLALDLIPEMDKLKATGHRVAVVGEVNTNMPFMRNHAEVADSEFDFILDLNTQPDHQDYALFAAPAASISPEDHLIGLYASTLLKDGGTLQVGIGSLSSALTYSTLLRHENNRVYNKVLSDLNVFNKFPISRDIGEHGAFEEGLYGCSELMVDGFVHLYKAGVLKREVFEDLTIQHLLNQKKISKTVTLATLNTLLEYGAINSTLTQADISYLKRYGVFRPEVSLVHGKLVTPNATAGTDISQPDIQHWIETHALGPSLKGGVVMHGAFFIGPRAFYDDLNQFSDDEHQQFCMTSVNYVNDLYDHMLGNQQLKQAQRKHARFINSGMMVTLDGSVVSDALENGQVVSGVGGQYNFVAQSHQLRDARSVIKIRSCAYRKGKLTSNILFNYGHNTIPRQLRDIVITEYGIADLRGKPDEVVYSELIKIADSRFQQQLLAQAKAAGKIAPDYQLPPEYANNTPDMINAFYRKYQAQGLFAPFPFGCSFTAQELKLGKALKALKSKTSTRTGKLLAILGSLHTQKPDHDTEQLIKRMKLEAPSSLEERITRRLLVAELQKQS
ncbi:acetyl-CoA hydrolase/transferase C-terminal domain-containing protein [Photobacterium ganghwense]|uniref:acetyl-CoA hydrolase/transferase C-terminal domain-containing protein n=1 Tax=Photobacterium ganghwense TaxID=320778 RepID=UPI001C2D3761|nr:acetyl-CoA hydrolase/transferase C-terminal domain-containing protein [Photobacterium ganghwense]MBV1840940.1 acetyl-CoA hydrolase [Photobacterium ganghwense]